jgi:hypothetical protein
MVLFTLRFILLGESMVRWRSASAAFYVAFMATLTAACLTVACAGDGFPFGSELILDAKPMRGSKRVPMLQIEENGTAAIDLWCVSLRGQATVGDIALAIVPDLSEGPGNTPQIECDLDRKNRDAELLAALTQVTGWRKSGDVVELSGPSLLRFRLMTN